MVVPLPNTNPLCRSCHGDCFHPYQSVRCLTSHCQDIIYQKFLPFLTYSSQPLGEQPVKAMHLSLSRSLLPFLTLFVTHGFQPSSAQTSTVIIIPTPLPYQSALSICANMGGPSQTGKYSMYPVPATPTDPVYAAIASRPEQKFWIRRRGGRTCTNLNKAVQDWTLLDEAICDEELLAVCKDCRFGGDGCS
ncbi:hypothetical protein V8F20_010849 [Naviculisporaceae sp. PSN 640]